TSEKLVYTVIGDQPKLKRFFERIRLMGEIKSISCQRASYQHYDVLSCLTNRQRDILIKAKKGGYYDYPRRINADQLAERLGIGKSATVEHLRKAEGRIISHIFSGY
ncbi:MAG TPA: helix-turn-helix domain-containing protein, partial [Methanothrix soehngenii]|nr:helix-turn-helix domain-containing protein [Methanothrix soehngenii]